MSLEYVSLEVDSAYVVGSKILVKSTSQFWQYGDGDHKMILCGCSSLVLKTNLKVLGTK